jgi:Flp pilus assembly protein CpaB
VAVAVLTPGRALRQPRRLDARALVGLFLLCAAVGGSVLFWRSTNDARAFLVATRELPAGATLQASDLAVAHLRADDALYATALPADEVGALVGKQLAEPVHAQQLLVRPQIATKPRLARGEAAMTIPVSAKTAAGGRVRPNDQVRVIVTRDKGKPESKTTVVLDRVAVHDVGRDEQTTVVNTSGADPSRSTTAAPIGWVTLVVTAEQAVELAAARWNGELDVVLLAPAQ